jgi:ligand-binding sensor domain-containing protein
MVALLSAATLVSGVRAEGGILPLKDDAFMQPTHAPYTEAEGLPSRDVTAIFITPMGAVQAGTADGSADFDGTRWMASTDPLPPREQPWYPSLAAQVGTREAVRGVATRGGEVAVAAATGLYLGDGETWALALPREGTTRWAPLDVRGVDYDTEGRLWFACPQGVGCRIGPDEWKLFTGAEGLPFNDFTCMAAGPGGVWFGTTNGAIRYANDSFEFRQGRRWLLDNHVRDIAVDAAGNAWIATSAGSPALGTRR